MVMDAGIPNLDVPVRTDDIFPQVPVVKLLWDLPELKKVPCKVMPHSWDNLLLVTDVHGGQAPAPLFLNRILKDHPRFRVHTGLVQVL